MRRAGIFALGLWLAFLAVPSAAAPPTEDIPETLRPWIPWVLHDHEDRLCPAAHDDAERRVCAWPARLALALTDAGGRFAQSWRVYADGWVPLPGSAEHWPEAVAVDGVEAVLSDREGVPHVRLTPGEHRVTGAFTWSRLPKSLRVTEAVGLIDLTVDGAPQAFPQLDERGELWLRERPESAPGPERAERVAVRVFRRVEDDLPMRLTTRLEIDVSGTPREVLLGPAMPEGAIPLALESALPARLEPEGRLRLQLRPGSWVVSLIGRFPGSVDRLTRPAADAPWPNDEVWAFQAHNELRLVEIAGVDSVEPRRAGLPPKWQRFPAYRVGLGDVFEIATKRRGDPDPAPDQLDLSRALWLDFDGRGYTVRDQIRGQMSAGWRFDMNPPFALGRVAVDGQDQLITRDEDSAKAGVELRRGRVDLTADSRVEGDLSSLNAVGWDHDIQRLDAVLHLPPGWRLANVAGADRASESWVQQWTMLALFLVLIIALVVGRLWNWGWGLLALVTLALTYHEPAAPRWVWLGLLAAIALLRVVPAGALRLGATWFRNLSLLGLVLITLPFMVLTVRDALYPQLERPGAGMRPELSRGRADAVTDERMEAAPAPTRRLMAPQAPAEAEAPASVSDYYTGGLSSVDKAVLDRLEPGARITTGPGLPRWTWTTVRLRWTGPVERDQTLRLTLVPPWLNRTLRLVGVLLVGVLAGLMIARAFAIRLPRAAATTGAIVGLLAATLAASGAPARAEFPDPVLLDALRDRLLETPDCFPHCAQIATLELDVEAERMSARLSVHAAEGVAVPLPGDLRFWQLQEVRLDGAPVAALRRDDAHRLWVHVPQGRHRIEMTGPLANEAAVPVPLALPPHRVTVRAEGWRVDGVDEDGRPQAQLQLTRLAGSDPTTQRALEPTSLPPFLKVERTLSLGLEWRLRTRVARDPATRGAVVARVPLLDGESVTSAEVRVENGEVLVNLPPERRELGWVSTLERRDTLTLMAPTTTEWSETWRLEASPIWRVASDGLPPVFHQDPDGVWSPVWRPWPGETLTLTVGRPTGVEGQTLTVDHSLLELRPGQRSTASKLTLELRSSQGGQHALRLPPDIRLESVSIDGRLEPVRARDSTVILPITPGRHDVVLEWREPRPITAWFSTSAVDLGVASVNSEIALSLPRDRWLVFTGGPRLGPAVLFWGVLLVVVAIAIGLGRVGLTPLRTHEWFLLGVGLTQAPAPVAVVVVGWLFALGARRRMPEDTRKALFNLVQVGLVGLTALALAGLVYAIQTGLLGTPDMQVMGNRSSAYALRWYQDRVSGTLPEAGVLTVSIWFYRFLMLAWALWLSFALYRWARWGWACYSAGGLWRPLRQPAQRPDPAAAANSD
jgi:hypothetical protein